MIALCAVLSGGESCADMALFGQLKVSFLRQFLTLPHGVPSHDTFSRVLRLLDPKQFRACFAKFMQRFAESCQGVVAIDGKTLRRSFDTAAGASPLHMVSAWGCEQRLVLGQLAVDGRSNEITAVPRLLELLSLKGTIVTADALKAGCVNWTTRNGKVDNGLTRTIRASEARLQPYVRLHLRPDGTRVPRGS